MFRSGQKCWHFLQLILSSSDLLPLCFWILTMESLPCILDLNEWTCYLHLIPGLSLSYFYFCLISVNFSELSYCFLLYFSSGREPSISSDTRTDSSTDSYSYKHSHSHHESMASHFSSDSQGTIVCNPENGASHSSLDTTGTSKHVDKQPSAHIHSCLF